MINKKHPDYEKYVKECNDARVKMIEELSTVEQPKVKGLDGLNVAIHKKFAKKIREIQKKYSYLFTD